MSSEKPSGRLLVITFIGLELLAGLSWLLADLGTGVVIAMGIAAIKALWIALVFMELRYAHAVYRTAAVIAVFFVVLLSSGAVADVAFRH